MNRNGNKVIFLYNLFTLLLCPLLICLAGFWPIEANIHSGRGKAMTIAVYIIFFPEVIFGLKWGLNSTFGGRIFTILCSMADGLILHKLLHYYYVTSSNAPITYYITNILMVFGIIWTIVIEFNEDLRDHILLYPQVRWLFPNAEDDTENRYWQLLMKILVGLSAVFLFYVVFFLG